MFSAALSGFNIPFISTQEKHNWPVVIGKIFEEYKSNISQLDAEFYKHYDNRESWNSKIACVNFFQNALKNLQAWQEAINKIMKECNEDVDTSHELEELKLRLAELAEHNLRVIADYQLSALERGLSLAPMDLSEEHAARKLARGTLEDRIQSSFREAHYIFNTPELVRQLSITCISAAVLKYAKAGIHHTAGREFGILACRELERKITANEIEGLNPGVQGIKQYIAELHPSTLAKPMQITQPLQVVINQSLQQKAAAFRIIYAAIRKGESGPDFFKTNFLSGKARLSDEELIREVLRYIIIKPHSRTARAWQIVNARPEYYQECHNENAELIALTHYWAFKNSNKLSTTNIMGVRMFSGATLFNRIQEETLEIIRNGNARQGSRMNKVYSCFPAKR